MGERFSSPNGSGPSPVAKRYIYLVNFRLTISHSSNDLQGLFRNWNIKLGGLGGRVVTYLTCPRLTSFIFVPQGFLWRILHRRGCLWTPLVLRWQTNCPNASDVVLSCDGRLRVRTYSLCVYAGDWVVYAVGVHSPGGRHVWAYVRAAVSRCQLLWQTSRS